MKKRGMMKSKKGQALSLTTIIIIILALIVLVIIAAAFYGGMAQFMQKAKEYLGVGTKGISEDVLRNSCNTWCNAEADNAYCTCRWIKKGDEKPVYQNCEDLVGECPQIGSCISKGHKTCT